jgi:Carboxypeptidase regulatory-like domain/TonB-dependent Receptor Plug Domain
VKNRCLSIFVFLCLVTLLAVYVPASTAQSAVSGEIDGTVTDASGAVVPNASVNLTSSETGFNESTTTSSNGSYRFALVKPGTYTLTVAVKGFSTHKRTITASVGQVITIPIQLEVGTASQTIEITAAAPLLQTENGNLASTIDRETIERQPSPGQDITNYALMTPGVTVSTGGGYGNFTANGQPGTSNLYTVNGNDYNDPFNNLNNSGASNLLLGANELQEITVVTNGYTGEYGRAAGANVNYSTKSGSNQFHGNAGWWWNGTALNANDWFSNQAGAPRGHAVSNQWVGSVGGPIIKDKLFFFFDYEGLRYVLPGGGQVFTPSDSFASATLANLAANPNTANEVPFYTTVFNLYKGAPGSGIATPQAGACGDLGGRPAAGGGIFDDGAGNGGIPCAKVFQSNVNSLNTERLYAITVDWNASPNDSVKFRFKDDYGVQATGTDPINAAFNANSVQPEKDGQVTWTHVLNNHTTNQLIAGGLHYGAIFGPPDINASLAVFPTTILFNDGAPFTNLGGGGNQGGGNSNFPQGRNVTQYQVVDDFSWTKGNHGIKFGVNYRGNRISSFAPGPLTSGLLTVNSLGDFYNGVASLNGSFAGSNGGDTYTQNFAKQSGYPESYYSLGLYIQDEVRASSHLKLTFALRVDRNSNEVCRSNCYARTAGSFANTDHSQFTPYDQTILTGLHTAFPQLQPLGWGPRVGFAWTPTSKGDLVIRGGGGIFTQLYPGLIGDRLITNAPNVTSFTVTGAGGDVPIALGPQGVPGSVRVQATNSNNVFQQQFFSGGTLASMTAAAPLFSPPNLNTIVGSNDIGRVAEWNLEVQKSFGASTVVALNYVGNHGQNIFVRNPYLNTYCPPTKPGCVAGTEFGALPQTAPDPRFGSVLELQSNGISNYNGLSASVNRRFTHGFSGTLNYNYSHSLDDVSNGGLSQYNLNNTANSFRIQMDPLSLKRRNYGNSDYDFRHSLSANYFYDMPFKSSNQYLNMAIGGWSLAGTFFYKSGEPFSVYNSTARSTNLINSTGGAVLADFTGGATTCGYENFSCPVLSQFTYAAGNAAPFSAKYQSNFGSNPRNLFRGPFFFSADFGINKDFKVKERMTFAFGATAFNVFNHANFDNAHAAVSSGATFGQQFQTVGVPNSPYGNFTGAIVNGRVLQLDLKFKF